MPVRIAICSALALWDFPQPASAFLFLLFSVCTVATWTPQKHTMRGKLPPVPVRIAVFSARIWRSWLWIFGTRQQREGSFSCLHEMWRLGLRKNTLCGENFPQCRSVSQSFQLESGAVDSLGLANKERLAFLLSLHVLWRLGLRKNTIAGRTSSSNSIAGRTNFNTNSCLTFGMIPELR